MNKILQRLLLFGGFTTSLFLFIYTNNVGIAFAVQTPILSTTTTATSTATSTFTTTSTNSATITAPDIVIKTMKGTGKPQIGFIAQEVGLVIPEVVEGVDGSLGISYGNLMAGAVEAIKEVNAKVDNLSNGLQMKDTVTGEIYCVTIKNSQWDKNRGICGSHQ